MMNILTLSLAIIAVISGTRADPVDIIFVMDDSASIGYENFIKMQILVNGLISTFDIKSGNTRVGVVVYSDGVEEIIHFQSYGSARSLSRKVVDLTYRGGGLTDTDDALRFVRTVMLTERRYDRPDVPNVVIVLTHGWARNPNYTQVEAEALKSFATDTTVFAVGIGTKYNATQLGQIATAPENVILPNEYGQLYDARSQLATLYGSNDTAPAPPAPAAATTTTTVAAVPVPTTTTPATADDTTG